MIKIVLFLEFLYANALQRLVNFQNRISPPIVHMKVIKQKVPNDDGDFLCKMMLILEM